MRGGVFNAVTSSGVVSMWQADALRWRETDAGKMLEMHRSVCICA